MKDLFMFKVTTALENEEEKEKTNLFGFKLIGKQIQLFSHRGELPTAHKYEGLNFELKEKQLRQLFELQEEKINKIGEIFELGNVKPNHINYHYKYDVNKWVYNR